MVAMVTAYAVLQLIAALRLVQVARRDNASALWWLAGFFSVSAVTYLAGWVIAPLFPGGGSWGVLVATIGEAASVVLLLFFTQAAFYQDRSSPHWALFIILLALTAVLLWFGVQLSQLGPSDANRAFYQVAMTVSAGLVKVLGWGWHLVVAWRSYRRIADSFYVEDWIKARYKLVIAYSVMALLSGFFLLSALFFDFNVVNALAGLMIILAIVPQFLAWVMPTGLRRYFNRNYEPPEQGDELAVSEEDLMHELSTG